LDHQVVRAALKAHHRLQTDPNAELTLSTRYLKAATRTKSTTVDWNDPSFCIHLLELRASAIVSGYDGEDRDAGAAHRLSTAVADAFVAGRVGEIMDEIKNWSESKTRHAVLQVLFLVKLFPI
jgi:acyl-CoA oxidase